MKNFIIRIVTLVSLFPAASLSAQPSDCSMPSGPLATAADSTICYTGFTAFNTGALTQFYTFTATSPYMEIWLTPSITVKGSFPATTILYSNMDLYEAGACAVKIGSGCSFSTLTPGLDYVWGCTMTPVDPANVYINHACPHIEDLIAPLTMELNDFSAFPSESGVTLSWRLPSPMDIRQFIIERKDIGSDIFAPVGTLIPGPQDQEFEFTDNEVEGDGKVVYRLRLRSDGFDFTTNAVPAQINIHHPMFTVFPNPAAGSVNFSFASLEENTAQLQVMNANGKSLFSAQGTGEATAVAVEELLAGLPAGIYWITCSNNGEKKSVKWVKL